MAFFRYFKRDSAGTFLPDPKGSLSTSLSTGTIKAANKAVLCDGRGQKAHMFFKLLISKIYSKANSNFFSKICTFKYFLYTVEQSQTQLKTEPNLIVLL